MISNWKNTVMAELVCHRGIAIFSPPPRFSSSSASGLLPRQINNLLGYRQEDGIPMIPFHGLLMKMHTCKMLRSWQKSYSHMDIRLPKLKPRRCSLTWLKLNRRKEELRGSTPQTSASSLTSLGYAAGSINGAVALKYFDREVDDDMRFDYYL